MSLELETSQNTKLIERLDRSMALLTQAVQDLRVQMLQGQADLRAEIIQVRADLRHEIAESKEELYRYIDRKFNWLMTVFCGTLLTAVGFLCTKVVEVFLR